MCDSSTVSSLGFVVEPQLFGACRVKSLTANPSRTSKRSAFSLKHHSPPPNPKIQSSRTSTGENSWKKRKSLSLFLFFCREKFPYVLSTKKGNEKNARMNGKFCFSLHTQSANWIFTFSPSQHSHLTHSADCLLSIPEHTEKSIKGKVCK